MKIKLREGPPAGIPDETSCSEVPSDESYGPRPNPAIAARQSSGRSAGRNANESKL